jgi:serine/threonine protein phosphatase 1
MLASAESHREVGNVLFVHGGVDPVVPIKEWFARSWLPLSRERDHFAWVREPFLHHQGPCEGGRFVVHGHSPEHRVMAWKGYPLHRAHMLDGWRLGLDGGTVATRRVVGAEIQTGRYRLYAAS